MGETNGKELACRASTDGVTKDTLGSPASSVWEGHLGRVSTSISAEPGSQLGTGRSAGHAWAGALITDQRMSDPGSRTLPRSLE